MKVAQRDLPLEVEDMPLRFDDLAGALRKLTGIRLIARVSVNGGSEPSEVPVPTITVAGKLGEPQVRNGSVILAIGDPEGDGGGVLRLPRAGLGAATLSTFDGNDFFIIRLEWSGISVLLQDDASGTV